MSLEMMIGIFIGTILGRLLYDLIIGPWLDKLLK